MIILFWLAKYRINKAGEAPLYMRITYEGKRAEVGLGQYILLKLWDNKRQKVKGDSDLVKQVNSIINSFKTKALATYDELFKTNSPITAEIIKNKLLGIDEHRKTLLEVFHYHNEQMKAKIGIEFAANTLKKYITCERKVVAFIEAVYHRKDVFLAELNYKFITDFDFYLKTHDKLKQNAVVKHVQQLKRIIKVSMLHGWLSNDPFINYSCKLKEVLRGYLTSDEVQKLESLTSGTIIVYVPAYFNKSLTNILSTKEEYLASCPTNSLRKIYPAVYSFLCSMLLIQFQKQRKNHKN